MCVDNAGAGQPAGIPGSITTVHRSDAVVPAEGEEWRCQVQAAVPYLVRFGVMIERVEVAALVRAKVTGDLVGDATLNLDDSHVGCTASLHSSLAPGNKALRVVSRFAAPIAHSGRDRVLDTGGRQCSTRAVEPLVRDETLLA